MSNPLRIALVGTLALVSIGLGIWFGQQTTGQKPNSGYTDMGGDFTLQSADGPVSLHDFRGKVVAIYFGYTHCPDICPTTLSALSQAFKQLTPDELQQVQGLFISVDPERDSPQLASAYARTFHPRIEGLSGTPEAIAEVAKRYFVLYEKVPLDDSAMGYAVDHSSIVYVLDKHGVVQELARHSNSPDDLVQALRKALKI